jgi:molybdopterin-binding protein
MKKRRLNIFEGRIKRIIRGPLCADLIVELAPGLEVISRLPASSLQALNARRGQMASVLIPSSNVVVAPA